MENTKKKVVIIGAGPAGLTAGYELLRQSDKYEVVIMEESGSMGGISRTVYTQGNRMDIAWISVGTGSFPKMRRLWNGGNPFFHFRESRRQMTVFLGEKQNVFREALIRTKRILFF